MIRTLLPGLARLVGLPGAASFRRFERVVRAAGECAEWAAGLGDRELAAAAAAEPPLLGERGAGPGAARFLALAREAAARTVALRAFDEQLLAACALLTGHAVEMDTGEGKTLVGAIAAAGLAASGRRVHVISVNDYLAERDARWMGPLLELLGVSTGWIGQRMPAEERRRAYRRDVVYAPVTEIGFDVLRDRFAVEPDEFVSPVFDAAIVDEADAVLIDQATTPLVLAGASDGRAEDLTAATALVARLDEGADFVVDAGRISATLTDAGLDRLERALGGIDLYAAEHIATLTRLNLALHARALLERDIDYVVAEGAVRLIDTGRGRIAHLQRWPDGLQAAVEAKEGLSSTDPGVILDSATIQDLMTGYRTLAGMSGTVVAVAEELAEFYGMRSGRVPRHRPNRRADLPDRVVGTAGERIAALVAEVAARHAEGRPVLLGTQHVAESELLGLRLREAGVPARVLNAKNDAQEAAIVARAGEPGAVTISTQISGRGTDIRLGGADERDRDRVVAAGGLAVVASGRYPSVRLDAQLRGRSGRQGDPGTSLVIAALDDELVLAHAPEHLLNEAERANGRRGERLGEDRLRRVVDAAQRIAEGVRRDRHRATWAYHRAIAVQRAAVLVRRRAALAGDPAALGPVRELLPERLSSLEGERDAALRGTMRLVLVHRLDERWTTHLALLREIRDGIHLRSLAGLRPEDEFHRIALREFHGFFDAVDRDAAERIAALGVGDLGGDPAALGLRRPSTTWTYMVTDDPFGTAGDRLARALGKRWRSRVLRIEGLGGDEGEPGGRSRSGAREESSAPGARRRLRSAGRTG